MHGDEPKTNGAIVRLEQMRVVGILSCVFLMCCLTNAFGQSDEVFDPDKGDITRAKVDTIKLFALDPVFLARTRIQPDTNEANVLEDYVPDFGLESLYLNAGRPQTYSLIVDDYRWSRYSDDDLFPAYIRPYRKTPETSKFMLTNSAFTNVMYVQAATQEEAFLELNFAKEFKGKYDFHLDYTNVKDIGSYANELIRHNNLAVHWQYRINEQWQWQLEYFGNFTNDEHNGGIETDSLLDDGDFSQRLAYPVYWEDGVGLVHEDHLFRTNLYYHVGLDTNNWYKSLSFGVSPYYQASRVQYVDVSPPADTVETLYSRFGISSNQVRYKFGEQKYGVDVSLLFDALFEGRATLKIENESFKTRTDTASSSIREHSYTNFALQGDVRKRLGLVDLQGMVLFGQKRDESIYNIQADLTLEPADGLQLYGHVKWSRSLPDFQYQRLNEAIVPEQITFDPINSGFIKAGLRYRYRSKLLLEPYIGISTWDNPIYHDASGLLVQGGSGETVTQFGLKLKFENRLIILENHLIQSNSEQDLIRKPNIINRSRLTLKQAWFKNRLKVNIGLQNTYMDQFDSYYYHPWYQDFLLSDYQVQNSFKTDFFINIRVDTFRFMLMLEDLTQLLGDTPIYFEGYPQRDFGIRLGINWLFFD